MRSKNVLQLTGTILCIAVLLVVSGCPLKNEVNTNNSILELLLLSNCRGNEPPKEEGELETEGEEEG